VSVDLATVWTDLDPSLPVALLPVRIETRFGSRQAVDGAGNAVEIPVLRVRIYPDELSVVAGREGLRAAEIKAGTAFWDEHGRGAVDDTDVADRQRRLVLWERLTRQVGVARAPHVARATRDGAPPALEGDAPPATARLLPDAWVVIASVDQNPLRVVIDRAGKPDTIQVGIAPGTQPFDAEDPSLAKDPALRWLTDFATAETEGMATTIDLLDADHARLLSPDRWPSRVESLTVLGVRSPQAERTPISEATALTDLLSAHAATDRISFVPTGTPTNNLGDRRSGWSGTPDPFAAYDRTISPPTPGATDGALRGETTATAEAALTAALGLEPGVLSGLDAATDPGQSLASAMSRALFPVTFGEFLQTLLHPVNKKINVAQFAAQLDEATAWAQDFIPSYVRGRGPLPTLRVGRQPYGVLPITLRYRWAARADDPPLLAPLVNVLGRLGSFWDGAFWDGSSSSMPRVDEDHGTLEEASAALTRVLGQGPVPHPGAYASSRATGSIASLLYFLDPVVELPQIQLDPGSSIPTFPGKERLAAEVLTLGYRYLIGDFNATTKGSLLQGLTISPGMQLGAEATADGSGAKAADYLAALAASTPPPAEPPTALLYQLLRRSLVLSGEVDEASFLREIAPVLFEQRFTLGPELRTSSIDEAERIRGLVEGPIAALADTEAARRFDLPEAMGTSSLREVVRHPEWTAVLDEALQIQRPGVAGFHGTVAAIQTLADAGRGPNALTDDDYARLLGETLACTGSRLDAWFTAVATHRLDAQRRAGGTPGVQIGHWGIVTNLVRRDHRDQQPAPEGWTPPVGSDGTVTRLGGADQVGYVHAPSLDHARTAGVLRAAEVAHGRSQSTLSALDLTSRRARAARSTIDAVASGQPLGAVLGARLERVLGDAGLHDLVPLLRQRYPQHRATGDPGTPAAGSDAVVPPEIVDGLDVWQAGPHVFDDLPDFATRREDFAGIYRELDLIVEAVADSVVAEGVHQQVTGRPQAANATFAAMAHGGKPPTDLDVLSTPRTGLTIDHRVVLSLDPTATPRSDWNMDAPRAKLAPELELWAQSLLREPGAVAIHVGDREEPIALSDLGVCALDVIVESADMRPADTSDAARQSLLDRRVLAAAGLSAASGVSVTNEDGDWSTLVAMATAIAGVLGAARPVTPVDVASPPNTAPGTASTVVEPPPPVSPEEIATRVVPLRALLGALLAAIAEVRDQCGADVPDDAPKDPSLLAPFAGLGLSGSIGLPGDATAGAARAAAAAATALLVDVARRLAASVDPTVPVVSGALPTGTDLPTPTQLDDAFVALRTAPTAAATLTDLFRITAGQAVLPVFAVAAPLAGAQVSTDPARDPGSAPLAKVDAWLSRASRVRDRLAAYDDLRLFADPTGSGPLVACQLPWVETEAWVAGPLPKDPTGNPLRGWTRPDGPRLHVVVAGPSGAAGPAGDGVVHGIVLDEFSEVLPSPTVTTGVAIHYDGPNARPPQSVLLAVHPGHAEPWSAALLAQYVDEAMFLARIRLVELEDLRYPALDQYLPLAFVREGNPDIPDLTETYKQPYTAAMLAAIRLAAR
jgi:hypothetical protein